MIRWEARLTRWARLPVILALAGVSLLFMAVVFPQVMPLTGPAPAGALDVRLGGYDVAQVEALMSAMNPAQRRAAAWGHLIADGLYPLVYGLLLALLLVRAWPERRFWLLAPLVVLADWVENALLAALYWRYPQGLAALTPWASQVTALKWALIALSVGLILGGGLRLLLTRRD